VFKENMSRPKNSTTEKRPTIADVAKAAGVSTTTVSFVINDTPGQTISPATQERVLKAVQDLNYKPNVHARALGGGHTNELAFVGFDVLRFVILPDWVAAIQERAVELGYTPVFYLYQGASRRAKRRIIESVLERQPAGLLAETPDFSKADLERARAVGVRACLVLGLGPESYQSAVTDAFEAAGQLVGAHLLERGHQRMAFVKPLSTTPTQGVGWRRSIKGFKRTTGQGGVTLSELAMDAGLESAHAAVDRLLALSERPTAIFGFMEDHALVLLKALLECGIRVPQDVAVVGMMDTYLSSLVHPALTSVRIDMKTIGAHYVDILDALIRNEQPSPELLVPPRPELIIRESS
jgi:LacI family purine nucleotide synthesis repressor